MGLGYWGEFYVWFVLFIIFLLFFSSQISCETLCKQIILAYGVVKCYLCRPIPTQFTIILHFHHLSPFFFFFFFFWRYNRQKPTAFVANAIFISSTKINSANKLLQTHETFRLRSHPVDLGMQTTPATKYMRAVCRTDTLSPRLVLAFRPISSYQPSPSHALSPIRQRGLTCPV